MTKECNEIHSIDENIEDHILLFKTIDTTLSDKWLISF